jgi:hypothetical protein
MPSRRVIDALGSKKPLPSQSRLLDCSRTHRWGRPGSAAFPEDLAFPVCVFECRIPALVFSPRRFGCLKECCLARPLA